MGEAALQYLIESGSYGIIFAGLIAAGLGVPVTEDVYLIASGVLAERGLVSPPAIFAVCCVGVVIGDVLIFTIARRLGEAAYRRKVFARLMPPERRRRVERLMERRGGPIVFGARFVAGVRMPVFAIAGVHKMSLARFLVWDIAALCFSAPIIFGLGYLFSNQVSAIFEGLASARHYVLIAVLGALALAIFAYALARYFRGARPGGVGRRTRSRAPNGARETPGGEDTSPDEAREGP